MAKQVLIIHGADAFSDYEDFLKHLRAIPIEDPLEREMRKRWKDALKEELSKEGYEVYLPSMPNRNNAHYAEWKIWFERYFTFLHDGVILVGHSQGGYFLAKYLSENKMPMKICALYLIAAPFKPDDFDLPAQAGGEDGGDFHFDTTKLGHLSKQVDEVFILHATDDPVVPYHHAELYREALPRAHLMRFKDRGHFSDEQFPELVMSIKAL